MNSLIINKKKYIVIEQEKFEELQQRAAQKTTSAQKLTLPERSCECSVLPECL